MAAGITIRAARADDLEPCVALLADAALPTQDLTPDHLALVAEIDGQIAGAIGLEQFAATGLLRSLVVARTGRGGGVGEALVAELESLARGRGIGALWLLTIDADAYFERLGYLATDRAEAPEPITRTEEFSNLCPGDAVLMQKRL